MKNIIFICCSCLISCLGFSNLINLNQEDYSDTLSTTVNFVENEVILQTWNNQHSIKDLKVLYHLIDSEERIVSTRSTRGSSSNINRVVVPDVEITVFSKTKVYKFDNAELEIEVIKTSVIDSVDSSQNVFLYGIEKIEVRNLNLSEDMVDIGKKISLNLKGLLLPFEIDFSTGGLVVENNTDNVEPSVGLSFTSANTDSYVKVILPDIIIEEANTRYAKAKHEMKMSFNSDKWSTDNFNLSMVNASCVSEKGMLKNFTGQNNFFGPSLKNLYSFSLSSKKIVEKTSYDNPAKSCFHLNKASFDSRYAHFLSLGKRNLLAE